MTNCRVRHILAAALIFIPWPCTPLGSYTCHCQWHMVLTQLSPPKVSSHPHICVRAAPKNSTKQWWKFKWLKQALKHPTNTAFLKHSHIGPYYLLHVVFPFGIVQTSPQWKQLFLKHFLAWSKEHICLCWVCFKPNTSKDKPSSPISIQSYSTSHHKETGKAKPVLLWISVSAAVFLPGPSWLVVFTLMWEYYHLSKFISFWVMHKVFKLRLLKNICNLHQLH